MKKILIILVASISLSFVACNKDEDIVIDTSETLDYIVVEYTPAPGQFINEPSNGFSKITTAVNACKYAESRLSDSQFVSLGSWGGYIIVKFKESIIDSDGYDFAISSNAFDTSNEPGIVWVMQDLNKNGLPDDEWFELKGSYFGKEGYERNYWVEYKKPDPKGNTSWIDSNGETGDILWLGNYHSQDYYYPEWIKSESYILYGSRLPSQARMNEITGQWQNDPFEWGYVDNSGSDFITSTQQNRFRISDAVTELNQPANLSSIDFIKVQTAVNSQAGWLGELSTEVSGFFRLH